MIKNDNTVNKEVSVTVIESGREKCARSEVVAIEGPLEIRLNHEKYRQPTDVQLAITMRTPGDDVDLTKGYLYSEGIIESAADISAISQVSDDVVVVVLSQSCSFNPVSIKRRLLVTASCGLCGKSGMEGLKYESRRLSWSSRVSVSRKMLTTLPGLMLGQQEQFYATGGMHAGALFDRKGELIAIKEDIGRHNALDKLVGAILDDDLRGHIILLSGRTSFELVQKVAMLGLPLLASIGPPSSMAIEVADEEGITLVGFLKEDRFNVYTHPYRIADL